VACDDCFGVANS